jgi:hypothetical protein
MTKNSNSGPFLAEAKAQLAAFMRGPWSAPQVAHVAGVPVGTVRNWADRAPRRITAPEFLKLEGEEREVRQGFTTAEMFKACALAEAGRNGIAPDRAEYFVDQLTGDLFERAFGRRTRSGREREAAELWAPGYLVAEVRLHESDSAKLLPHEVRAAREIERKQRERGSDGTSARQSIQKVEDLGAYFADPERKASVTWIVVDTAQLLRRILAKMGNADYARTYPHDPAGRLAEESES